MNARFAMGLASLGVALAVVLAPVAALADTVGAAAAVRPSSTGTLPGAETRTLDVGSEIFAGERLRTTGSGSLQVMFNDKSTLTVGPNSDLVVDKFVYDPAAAGGSFVTDLTKGALRFVGGAISHSAGATIQTPVATLVIRGGAAFVTHDSICEAKKKNGARGDCTKVVCTAGTCFVRSRLDSRSIQLRISQAVEIGSLGTVQFNVRSVTLSDVAKGGDGSIVVGKSANAAANFAGQSTIDSTVLEQSPEPAAPPAPP